MTHLYSQARIKKVKGLQLEDAHPNDTDHMGTICGSSLPDYSPSVPAPSYSFEPTCGEQRLEYTLPRYRRPLTSTIVRKLGKATLVLNEQDNNAQIPCYGRGDVISGALSLDDPMNITDVVIKACSLHCGTYIQAIDGTYFLNVRLKENWRPI
ncbi:hypothetical protein AX17_005315 [Amanita inopinata Kibby_2008]|nr:hypothetical protein AX17_005315 [Amanita inopinata Kibby_2008]